MRGALLFLSDDCSEIDYIIIFEKFLNKKLPCNPFFCFYHILRFKKYYFFRHILDSKLQNPAY